MTGNIIGEPTEQYVVDQVKTRQQVYGKGFEVNTQRSIEEINYLNNRNAWIKMASSVSVTDQDLRLPLGISNPSQFGGSGLAQKSILFNGLSSLVSDNSSPLLQRSDVSLVKDSFFNNSAYGLGGTQFGIQPMPGISQIQIDSKNRGSIRTATVEVTAFNRFQFELIETLYLRLGFTMLIEWGWDRYISSEDNKVKKIGNTLIEQQFFGDSSQDNMLLSINNLKEELEGNYDAFFGRVVNFNWEFNPDGSYNITIKLTSLGDVIESLKINQSPSQQAKNSLSFLDSKTYTLLEEADSAITNNKATTRLGIELYKKLNNSELWGSSNSNYYSLQDAIGKTENYKDVLGEDGKNIAVQYNYFIRFGELCKIIQEKIIPNVNDTAIKHLEFDLSPENTICNYTPNLISFDPKVCIINMDDNDILNQDTIKGIKIPSYTSQAIGGLEPFKITKDPGNITFGTIYNIYINYDTIFKSLKDNVDKKGNLTLFKFLLDICDKINSSFANVLDIEPIIKEDKVITFLDQKPIMGLSNNLSSLLPGVNNETAILEVYGFNGQKPEPEGTFLKNITFNTKLSPKLANQLSIGATARGVAVEEDATGFSNWNRGLVDRFQKTLDIEEEPPKTTKSKVTTTTTTTTYKVVNGKKIKISETTTVDDNSTTVKYKGSNPLLAQIAGDKLAKKSAFPKEIVVEDVETFTYTKGSNNQFKKVTSPLKFSIDSNGELTSNFLQYEADIKFHGRDSNGSRIESVRNLGVNLSSKDLLALQGLTNNQFIIKNRDKIVTAWVNGFAEAYGVDPGNYQLKKKYRNGFDEFVGQASGYTIEADETLDDTVKDSNFKRLKKLSELNYSAYLARMFGGKPTVDDEVQDEAGILAKEVSLKDTFYPFRKDGEDFSSSGKSSYKVYLNEFFANKFKEENNERPSNQIGLIPVEFDMEMDGISGFKIYNKIEINQRFLPSNYGEALEFLVKGVNHTIDLSGWTTNLQTLSTSNLNSIPIKSNITEQDRTRPVAAVKSAYPELPVIPQPPADTLPFKEAVTTLKSITDEKTSKAVFAVLYAEASRSGDNFNSAGGKNYAGVQTDNARWGGGASNFIKQRFVRVDSGGDTREFAVFNSNQDFLSFMANRIKGKGFDGNDKDQWTSTYINSWWSPADKNKYTKGTETYNNKLAIYNTAIKKYNSVA